MHERKKKNGWTQFGPLASPWGTKNRKKLKLKWRSQGDYSRPSMDVRLSDQSSAVHKNVRNIFEYLKDSPEGVSHMEVANKIGYPDDFVEPLGILIIL